MSINIFKKRKKKSYNFIRITINLINYKWESHDPVFVSELNLFFNTGFRQGVFSLYGGRVYKRKKALLRHRKDAKEVGANFQKEESEKKTALSKLSRKASQIILHAYFPYSHFWKIN